MNTDMEKRLIVMRIALLSVALVLLLLSGQALAPRTSYNVSPHSGLVQAGNHPPPNL